METFKSVLGSEHPDTLTSIGNLASTFWNQGWRKEAEELEVVNNLAFELRAVEGGGRARCASDGDVFKGAWFGAFFYTYQHDQPGVDVLELRAVEGGRRVGHVSDGGA
ncbi:uncharacterized protein K441DRAFT_654944 [Cenococcum geophilum 1.58]|uniref:uncharacterized protein n=1 Tax=Cenococcum geophilum 1.58 TaxID=794803 RepID=UPI00358F45DE|nr:hypothetical protein K441DRAFT_654944 [Cenococcum geophilum 1.58]